MYSLIYVHYPLAPTGLVEAILAQCAEFHVVQYKRLGPNHLVTPYLQPPHSGRVQVRAFSNRVSRAHRARYTAKVEDI